MSNWEKQFQKWVNTNQFNRTIKQQLREMKSNKEELTEDFDKPLTLKKGRLLGVLGPGINRINIYTVRKAVKGLAFYIEKNGVNYKDRGVVVAYDNRNMSKDFAMEAAKVLGAHDIKSYVFASSCPTPILSFAVRYVGAVAGIMITAGHSPSNYNGLNVYNESGNEISLKETSEIMTMINRIENKFTIDVIEKQCLIEKNMLRWINDEVNHAYLEQLCTITKMDDHAVEKDLNIIFTPLHGTSLDLITNGLRQINFKKVNVVEVQSNPDPNFSTVLIPDPHKRQTFTKSIQLGKTKDADILLASSPDAERLGVAVKNDEGTYVILSSNELRCLLLDYILSQTNQNMVQNALVIKTIVCPELAQKIAHSYGVRTIDSLDSPSDLEVGMTDYNVEDAFVLGYEENYRLVVSNFSSNKDAIQTAVMACEMGEFWKRKGMSLLDALDKLYKKHGYFKEGSIHLPLDGSTSSEKVASITHHFVQNKHESCGKIKTKYIENYLSGTRKYLNDETGVESVYLSKGNVLKYVLEDQSWFCMKLSETEREIKCYFGVYSRVASEANAKIIFLKKMLQKTIEQPVELST